MLNSTSPRFKSLLLQFYFNDQYLADGTGFLVKNNNTDYLITARHNLTGRDNFSNDPLHTKLAEPNRVKIFHLIEHDSNAPDSYCWDFRTEALKNEANEPLWYEHPQVRDRAFDVAALRLKKMNQVITPAYSFLPDHPFKVRYIAESERILLVGFPFGKATGGGMGIWSTGFVATLPTYDYEGLPVFLVDCRARKGQSGSPVVWHKSSASQLMQNMVGGEETALLGVYSGRINKDSDLGMVWKTTVIEEILTAI